MIINENIVENLKKIDGVDDKIIAIIAPIHIKALLLNAGYELIEFVNDRDNFTTNSCYIMKLNNNKIELKKVSLNV